MSTWRRSRRISMRFLASTGNTVMAGVELSLTGDSAYFFREEQKRQKERERKKQQNKERSALIAKESGEYSSPTPLTSAAVSKRQPPVIFASPTVI
ncbi:hypothetical protein AVEN_6873-1 [Araneus ventricosus]|uniref:Uncharacterized protein n=1 Tax=Araneus ventricosus TaxID=182803 RepID=A0A4Y2NGH8_ARAVE|nr:hypothetical protein AVEN_6873-1 [Araneus ventricosus]